jgi:1,4-dihydroxy-2-naphthoyl-CoA hydrolase
MELQVPTEQEVPTEQGVPMEQGVSIEPGGSCSSLPLADSNEDYRQSAPTCRIGGRPAAHENEVMATDTSDSSDRDGTLGADFPVPPLHERMGIVVTFATPQRAEGTLPVDGNTQPYGLLHGGASAVLAEGLGSIAAHLHGTTLGKLAVGVDLNVTHHRSVRSGLVHGVATAIHLGASAASYEIVLTDDADRRICTGRLTCMLIEPR